MPRPHSRAQTTFSARFPCQRLVCMHATEKLKKQVPQHCLRRGTNWKTPHAHGMAIRPIGLRLISAVHRARPKIRFAFGGYHQNHRLGRTPGSGVGGRRRLWPNRPAKSRAGSLGIRRYRGGRVARRCGAAGAVNVVIVSESTEMTVCSREQIDTVILDDSDTITCLSCRARARRRAARWPLPPCAAGSPQSPRPVATFGRPVLISLVIFGV